ncbi:hypothetical protein KUA19_41180 [Catellatospora sp. NEAU-YM18]|nr:hypothetical protein [Catellatospora tritici]
MGAVEAARRLSADTATAAHKLRTYYDVAGDYAGRAFLDLAPNERTEFSPADLLAVTLLNVVATPRGVRDILGSRAELSALLAAVPGEDLAGAGVATLRAASTLYLRVKALLGENPWVVASKLCARKRPELIPVRDGEIVKVLGLTNRSHRTDWIVLRCLVRDEQIRSNLDLAAGRAEVSDIPLLRLLDTLLWMSRSD